jgi:hypothetical protein
MRPVQPRRPGPGQFVAAITQQPQHLQVSIDGELPQAPVPQRHHHHRVGTGDIGLAAMPGVEHPGPGGQLGRHVQHPLGVGEQPPGDRRSHPVGALHRPHPVRPLPGEAQHRPIAGGAGGERTDRPQHLPVDRHRPLVRGPSRSPPVHPSPPHLDPDIGQRGPAPLFRAEQTLLQPRLAAVPDRAARHEKATPNVTGGRPQYERPTGHLPAD